jgi:cytochrome c oxidase subunit 2
VPLLLVSSFSLVGCGGPASTLDARGPGAQRNDLLFWGMAVIAALVFVVTIGLLLYGLLRRRRLDPEEAVAPITQDRGGMGFVVGGGVVFPVVVLVTLFVLTMVALGAQAAEDHGPTVLTVQVVGHRWWWEIRYPQQGFTTANELHIPVGQQVRIDVTSADVIHSFWVPSLGRKMDAIPGRTNSLAIEANVPGTFRGECAEFCGVQHANMAFLVVAQTPASFQAWLTDQEAQAAPPAGALASRGERVFLTAGCATCHTIRGTPASGTFAPDLTHLASRGTLAAGTIPNTVGNLGGWIEDPQGIKPGNLMPPQHLTGPQLQALLAYLRGLR